MSAVTKSTKTGETTSAAVKKAIAVWRAVYVKSRNEKTVMNTLLQKDVEAYAPFVKTVRQWSDRKKTIEIPLLNGYVFVKVRETEHDIVLRTAGIVRFVRSEGRIALVRENEIDRLKQLVDLGYQLEAGAIERRLVSGEKVKIGSGPLRGIEGRIVEDKDQKQLLIVLESIGQCIRVRLPKEVLIGL